jgi:hypothetical protein
VLNAGIARKTDENKASLSFLQTVILSGRPGANSLSSYKGWLDQVLGGPKVRQQKYWVGHIAFILVHPHLSASHGIYLRLLKKRYRYNVTRSEHYCVISVGRGTCGLCSQLHAGSSTLQNVRIKLHLSHACRPL